ncbi:hypothetical protein [Streptomyces sp. NPDC058954]|uniref:hypothetical protein n=1 Tax=Streptomyces sp. NPDC058954 TaxID=3346677 RepID=UPI003696B216
MGELLRDYDGFDLEAFQRMMRDVFYPINHGFLRDHNFTCITHYWANWDLCNIASILAIAILCEDADKFDEAVTYFRSGAGNGSVEHAIPHLVWAMLHSHLTGSSTWTTSTSRPCPTSSASRVVAATTAPPAAATTSSVSVS